MRFQLMNRMVVAVSILLILSVSVFAALQSPRSVAAPVREAQATLRNQEGQAVGEAHLYAANGGVRLIVTVRQLPPGLHAIHLHETGRCQAPGFESAGPHLNPHGRQHGEANPMGPHAGDLPNLYVKPNGEARYEVFSERVTMSEILDQDGAALVIHAQHDDYRTDPSGQSGERIVCGAVEAVP